MLINTPALQRNQELIWRSSPDTLQMVFLDLSLLVVRGTCCAELTTYANLTTMEGMLAST